MKISRDGTMARLMIDGTMARQVLTEAKHLRFLFMYKSFLLPLAKASIGYHTDFAVITAHIF